MRQLRYSLIGEHLAQSKAATPRLMSFEYEDEGILVKGNWYPTLIMDWFSGVTLDQYLTKRLKSSRMDNAQLCKEWVATVRDLRSRQIAHGDLQHENVLVRRDGTFQLIDYDGMFVPAMRAHDLKAAEVGRPAYQHSARGAHPPRTDYFDERLDDFGALVILLSLAAVDAPTWTTYHDDDDDRLIIGEKDLREPSESSLLGELAARPGPVATLTQLLVQAARGTIEDVPSFETVVADPDVQALLDGSTYRQTTTAPRRRSSLPPGLLPRSPDEFVAPVIKTDLPKSRAPARAGQAATKAPKVAAVELTSREAEIARLLAEGLSVPEIAGQLTLARQTVDRHLRTIRTKSGSDSTGALTAWAKVQFPPPPESKSGKQPSSRIKKPAPKGADTARPRRATKPAASPPTRPPSRTTPAASPSQPPLQQPRPAASSPDLSKIFEELWPDRDQPKLFPFSLVSPWVMELTDEGEEHLRGNRIQEALHAFDLALAEDPPHVPALVGRGEAYRRAGRFDEALGDLNRALKLEPGNARARQVRSETNRDAGRKVRALTDRLRAKWRGGRNA